MPYTIKEEKGRFHIVRDDDGKTVGTSDSREKAERSIGYRMNAEQKSKTNE